MCQTMPSMSRYLVRANLTEAAIGLFAALRRLDASPALRICAELMPNQGLGLAINDRLLVRQAGAKAMLLSGCLRLWTTTQ